MDFAPLLETLLRWRFTLSLIVSIAAALALSNLFEWFTAKYALGVVVLCSGFGALWAGRAEDGGKPIPTPKLSKPVAFLVLSFFGAVAGGLVSGIVGGTLVATLVVAICPAVVAIWNAVVERKKTTPGEIVFRTISLLSGWAIVLIIFGSKWMSDF